EDQPPAVLNKIARRADAAAQALDLAADAMEELAPNYISAVLGEDAVARTRHFADLLRRTEDSFRQLAVPILRSYEQFVGVSPKGGRMPMVRFTGLIALLARVYARSRGHLPGFSPSGPFMRLVEESLTAITRAGFGHGTISQTESARARHVERVLNALKSPSH